MSEVAMNDERMKIIVATKNVGKLEEVAQLLSKLPYDVISMSEAGMTDDIEENGDTFEENALIKARAVWKVTGETVIADDSGLVVDYLGGAPGIHSARYAGEGATDADKNNKLLSELAGVPADKKTARFVCAIGLIFPDGKEHVVKGLCEGYIVEKPVGNNGFGYDPLFYVQEFGLTIAQMDADLKNSISHRGNALRKILGILEGSYR
jgi:XTP/dITP diphosphohydrolase